MKKLRKLFAAFVVVALLVVTVACNQETPVLQINDVVSDPGAFDGPMTVIGIAYAYAQTDRAIVGVMDKKELQCTTPNCSKVLLPVKVAGPVPAIGDEVRISGSFSREPWGYLFQAEKLEVLANHKLGGQG